jgi:hypothetical protein
MGKASRKKHLKRQQIISLEKYSGVKLSEALMLYLLLLSSEMQTSSSEIRVIYLYRPIT